MKKKSKGQITTTLDDDLIGHVSVMAKSNGMTKSRFVNSLCWIGYGALTSEHVGETLGELREAMRECDQGGVPVDAALIDSAKNLAEVSVVVLSHLPARGRTQLQQLLPCLIKTRRQAEKINEERWLRRVVDSAGAGSKEVN